MAENLSDALIMAGAILIFVIALTVSMSSFTTMRTQIDEIIEYDSKLDLVTDEHGNYINYFTYDSDVREVGIETVVSSMYRVSKENYKVYIAGLSETDINNLSNVSSTTLHKKSAEDGKNYEEPYYKDEELFGTDDAIIEISINGKNSNISAILGYGENDPNKRLYDKLKDKKFKEYLGVYQEKTDESVDRINKTTYRVITYIIQNS